ncbi:MAG: M23 family metallopeptidase [Bacteroidetes bacterium]|nr:M23 family metallopeptidase [Bacteroidota bacterium]
MSKAQKKSAKNRSKLFDTFKLLVVNDDTFEEVYAQRLTRLNAFVFLVVTVAVISVATFFIISATPLRFLIPGIESSRLQRQAELLLMRTDSLEQVIERDANYIEMISKVMSGEVTYEAPPLDSTVVFLDTPLADQLLEARKSIAMIELESSVKKEESYNPIIDRGAANPLYFAPLSGVISGTYDLATAHLAIDIAAKEGAAVKAITDGTVLHAEWSASTGYNLVIVHQGETISVYKHNGALFKKQGESVTAGDVVASVGNTGELSSGAHLHFELWKQGKAVDPMQYIKF